MVIFKLFVCMVFLVSKKEISVFSVVGEQAVSVSSKAAANELNSRSDSIELVGALSKLRSFH